MDVELVAGPDLESTLRDWEALQASDPELTPFSSAAWARAWLEHWPGPLEPWVMRIRDGERVAGIAPLAVRRVRGLRVLSMIGKEPGDYWDVIAAPNDRVRVAEAVGAELGRRAGAWELGILSCLPVGSPTLEGFARAGLRIFRRPPIRSPAIPLPSSFEAYLGTLPRSRRANLRRHLKRLDQGEVVIQEVRQPGEIPDAMNRWRELRARQWQSTGKQINPSHLEDAFCAFMVDAATRLLESGQTCLWQVFHDSRLAGVYLNFCDHRAFYWYLGGYEPDLAGLGVGKIVIAANLRASIQSGREWYDFTRGEDEYKYWYGAQDRLLDSVIVGHPAARSRLALGAARAASRYRSRRSGA
jgi:CelD/BcsL family acetyltransferase involved in cellulose biosynthesis